MKPTEPAEKIHRPREFAERAAAVLAERMEPTAGRSAGEPGGPAARDAAPRDAAPREAAAPGAQQQGGPGTAQCALCGNAADGLVTLESYRTAQRELLARWMFASRPGFSPAAPMHRSCLERVERELQAAQFVSRRGVLHYVDPTLGTTPILPTPLRMGADLALRGRGITIAFVDSGFYPHTEFTQPTNRVLALYDAVRDREIRSIGRLVHREPPVEAWHGTMAAATAAGSGHASGGDYRGIASEAHLVFVRAMTPSYRIRTPQVVRALEWIKANRERLAIRVVNMSVGVDEATDSMAHPVIALVEELAASGVVIVAASGNNPTRPITPPGAAPSAITVGGYNDFNSTEWMRREIWHSSYGRTPGGAGKPELLAPAIWVAAPILPNTAVKAEADALFDLAAADDAGLMKLAPALAPATRVADALAAATGPVEARSIVLARIAAEKLITADYKHVDGTSFAAPIVSSVVAQMLEARPDLSPAAVKQILCATAVLLPGVPPEVQGCGVVNPPRAVTSYEL